MTWTVWDDATRTVRTHTRDGKPIKERRYTREENAAADQTLAAAAQEAAVATLEDRVAALEAALSPSDPPVKTPGDRAVPDWDDLQPAGWWRNGALVRDNGVIYRNISGRPLRTRPTELPGGDKQWAHLFAAEAKPRRGADNA